MALSFWPSPSPVAELAHEHVRALADPLDNAHQPPHGPQAAHEARQGRHATEHLLPAGGQGLDLPEVARRLLGQVSVLLEEGLELRGQRPDLPLEGPQGLLGGARGAGELDQARDGGGDERQEGDAGEQGSAPATLTLADPAGPGQIRVYWPG